MNKKDQQIHDSSGNVFTDLGFEKIEAENLLVRSKLMAAERFGVAQPRISEIYQGKIDLFSVDKLINMLARVGRHVEVTVGHLEKWSFRPIASLAAYSNPHVLACTLRFSVRRRLVLERKS